MTANGDLGDLPFELTETDRENLVQGDKAFEPLTWDEVKAIIGKAYHSYIRVVSR